MGRAIFGMLMLIIYSPVALSAGAAVFDAANASYLLDMIGKSSEQLDKLQNLHNRLQHIGHIIGGNKIINKMSINDEIRRFSNWFNIINNKNDNFNYSVHSLLEENKLNEWDNYPKVLEQILDQLVLPKGRTISISDMNNVQSNLSQVTEIASISGLAVAGVKQSTLKETQNAILQLGIASIKTENIHEDMQTSNKFLSIIAQELTQLREIQAKQLEILAAFSVQMTSHVLGSALLNTKSRDIK